MEEHSTTMIDLVTAIGGIGGLGYIASLVCKAWNFWKNRLKDIHKDLLKIMLMDKGNISVRNERNDFCLYLKRSSNGAIYPSQDILDIKKGYEAFEQLQKTGYIRHGKDEIYTLTAKGTIKARNLLENEDKSKK